MWLENLPHTQHGCVTVRAYDHVGTNGSWACSEVSVSIPRKDEQLAKVRREGLRTCPDSKVIALADYARPLEEKCISGRPMLNYNHVPAVMQLHDVSCCC